MVETKTKDVPVVRDSSSVVVDFFVSGIYGFIHFPLGIYRLTRRCITKSGTPSERLYVKNVVSKLRQVGPANLAAYLILYSYKPILLAWFGLFGDDIVPAPVHELLLNWPVFICERCTRWCNLFLVSRIGQFVIEPVQNAPSNTLSIDVSDTISCVVHALIFEILALSSKCAVAQVSVEVSLYIYFICEWLLNGMYAFDYKYYNQNIGFLDRLKIFSYNYPHIMAFGMYSSLPDFFLADNPVLCSFAYVTLYYLSVLAANEVEIPLYKSFGCCYLVYPSGFLFQKIVRSVVSYCKVS